MRRLSTTECTYLPTCERCHVLLREVYAGRVQRGRGQGDRGPRNQSLGKGAREDEGERTHEGQG